MVLWQPDKDALVQLVEVLRYGDRPDTASQQLVVQQLDHFSTTVPSFPAYLVYIFALCTDEVSTVRIRAGLSLQNSVKQHVVAFPPDILEYVKQTIFDALQDSNVQIRNTASSVLDWLFRSVGPSNWPEAIIRLLQFMNSQTLVTQEAAYKAIANISRQSPRVLADLQLNDQRPWDSVLPALIFSGLISESLSIRESSLHAITPFIVSQPVILQEHLSTFLSNVFKLTADSDMRIRKAVVECLNTFLSFWPEPILPHIDSLIDYMLYCLQAKDEEEDLALTAVEFILTFTEEPELYQELQLHLEKFLPGLLYAITYTPNSREVLDLAEEDYQKADKATDIKPHIHKNRTTGTSVKVPSLATRMGMTAEDLLSYSNGAEEEVEDQDEEDEEDEEDDSLWTVRRAASRALEASAEMFETALLEILLPNVTEMLSGGNWYQREAALYALGNVAVGCSSAMESHLPSLVPYLLDSLNDPNPLIRSSASWTLGGYSAWIVSHGNSGENQFLLPTVQGLLMVALDNNKHAQGNAMIAFGNLVKEAGPTGLLRPYLSSIAQAFVAAFAKYQHKNILNLYDTIALLSDGVGFAGLNNEAILSVLMPPIIERWQSFEDTDPSLLEVLECLVSLTLGAGDGFKPYAGPILERAYRLVQGSLHHYQLYQADPGSFEKPENSWLTVSLDLIGSVVQALGEDSATELLPFVQTSQEGSLSMFLICMSYPIDPVRQSAFALVGDLAGKAMKTLYPVLGQLLPILVEAISPIPKLSKAGVQSNAIWAIGELAMVLGGQMKPFASDLLERLVPILSSNKASASLLENTIETIGHLALVSPQQVSDRLQTAIHTSTGQGQDAALRGMCLAIKSNPAALGNDGRWLLQALSGCSNPSKQLIEVSTPIIDAVR